MFSKEHDDAMALLSTLVNIFWSELPLRELPISKCSELNPWGYVDIIFLKIHGIAQQ